jgi:cathepsin B
MKSIVILLLLGASICFFTTPEVEDHSLFVTEEKLAVLSSTKKSFETYSSVEEHPFRNWKVSQIKKLMGMKTFFPVSSSLEIGDLTDLPESFDARTQWPGCVHEIRNQAHCGSCWAFAASEVLSDRFCIASSGKVNVVLSPEDLVSCDFMDHGCQGGNPVLSWTFLRLFGIVSDECKPYTAGTGEVDKCVKKCANDNTEYKKYKAAALPTVMAGNVQKIKESLVKDGPVETGFQVYEDFMNYKSGVYSHSTGKLLGGHAVKIVGYGVEDGVAYWTVANSWGPTWGENGYFKIKQGDCNFEGMAIASTPDLS